MSSSAPKEIPCPDCNEMVRVNSLRCWNCGGFMNPQMAEKYMAMQANPAPVILSEVPAAEMHEAEEGDEEGFQLSVPMSRPSAGADSDEIKIASSEAPPEPESIPLKEEKIDDTVSAEAAPPKRPVPEEPTIAHSVATGGDALLDIAMNEHREQGKRNKARRMLGGLRTPGGGLIIFCPYGCRVEVKESHRGMTGKCPRCEAPFIVPVDPPKFKAKAVEASAQDGPAEAAFKTWINDLHLHVVDPVKLKLKADSLLKEFVEVDVGCAPNEMLVAVLGKGKKPSGGMFAKAGDVKSPARQELLQYLAEGKPVNAAPVSEKWVFNADQVREIQLVQPASNPAQNIFHGIPVFGAGKVAVRLPYPTDGSNPRYLSMGITQFWTLKKALREVYGIEGLGDEAGLPKDFKYSVSLCHYLETPIKALQNLDFYKSDPSVTLEVAGYQCGACKATVSEAGRKKENLGGKSPKGIAKAKCPKCGSKMGENLLYSLKQEAAEPALQEAGA